MFKFIRFSFCGATGQMSCTTYFATFSNYSTPTVLHTYTASVVDGFNTFYSHQSNLRFAKGTMVRLTQLGGGAKVCSKVSLDNDLRMESNGIMSLIGIVGALKQFYVRINLLTDSLAAFGSSGYKPFYLGCFSRNNGINYFLESTHNSSMRISMCINYCRSFSRYFASIRNR